MNNKILGLKNKFLEKNELLENARVQLKSEFVGIDSIIDEVINNVSSWYMLSDIQERPVVINLWGLTGVGKTSLINRLVELIAFSDHYFRFDLGSKSGRFSFDSNLVELSQNDENSPSIIALDEFQLARTVEGPFRTEIDKPSSRKIWDLIDSGKMTYINWNRNVWAFAGDIDKMESLFIKNVIIVENGIVVKGKKHFKKEFMLHSEIKNEIPFVGESMCEDIIRFAGKKLNLKLISDVKNLFVNLTNEEIISFLKRVVNIAKRPIEKNFSKALIFTMGNLDEVYTMSNNLSADVDADIFHEKSLKITVPKIKNALKKRFRDEQIARLGNVHLIYPALSKNAYEKIIENELNKIGLRINKLTDLNLEFDSSLIHEIYKEGVYPTQGVRPVLTTINHLVSNKLSEFLTAIVLKKLDVDTLKLSAKSDILHCKYYQNTDFVSELEVKIDLKLKDIRLSKKDDKQAIVAVHESGHALLSVLLLKTLPEVVYSVTSDADTGGFVFSKFTWGYISRKEIIPRAAMMLGGYVAEELIFGKENLTTGASGDIQVVTNFLSDMIKSNGMGGVPIQYSLPEISNNYAYNNFIDVEEQVKSVLEKGLALARETLKKERRLLLVISDYLSDHSMLKKAALEKLINENTLTKIPLIDDGKLIFYRSHLKKEVEDIEILKPNEIVNEMMLNKEVSS